jgi:hypothetical protein
MYWANRLMDPNFKNEYYQANLKQFWDNTYSDLCISFLICTGFTLSLFPWGILSGTHPLVTAGWGTAVGQVLLSYLITFVSILTIERSGIDEEKVKQTFWLMVISFIAALVVQHKYPEILYRSIPSALLASLIPMGLLWVSVIGILKLPESVVNNLNKIRNQMFKAIGFLILDPKTGTTRLTTFLAKTLGTPPERPYKTMPETVTPKPKDYKIWGVKSSAEKDLQKILDE